jgi:hypothetical protein
MDVRRKLHCVKPFSMLMSTLTIFLLSCYVTSLIESTIKMQHSVHDKKKIENETNVIKCSAQLFQGPIDNADFVVYLLHPTDHHEKSQRQTLINFSEVQVIPIQSAEPCRKNDESFISAGKVEDIMK